MPILKDLPSNPSTTYSKEDIELFDKYRAKYKDFTERIKLYLHQKAKNTFNYDDLLEECDGNINLLEVVIMNDFTIFTGGHKCANEILYHSLANRVQLWNSNIVITAFYIPNNISSFKIFSHFYGSNKKILIGSYRRETNKIPKIDLKTILEESKSLDFIGTDNLENILLNSKNKIIENQQKGKKIIEFNGIEYERIELIQPCLPVLSTEEIVCIHIEYSGFNDCNLGIEECTRCYYEYIVPDWNSLDDLIEGENVYFGNIDDDYILFTVEDGRYLNVIH